MDNREIGAALVGRRIGNYTLVSVLGSGGMGTVFLATHAFIHRKKAVKVLHPESASNPALVRRFFDEAVAASACEHDHIVRIEDCGTLDPDPSGTSASGGGVFHYLEMEWLDGTDLGRACREMPGGRLPDVARATRIIAYAADALAAAHARGVVHRDVKPENLFLAQRGHRSDYVKVLDFGIARLLGDLAPGTRTRTGQIMGTPAYMSPEQAAGHRVDDRSDVFSLGVVLYRVLAGVTPFSGDSFARMALALKTVAPLSLAHHRSDVPVGLDRAIQRALAKVPSERPSMAAFRDLLLAADAVPTALQPELSIRAPLAPLTVSAVPAGTRAPSASVVNPAPRTEAEAWVTTSCPDDTSVPVPIPVEPVEQIKTVRERKR